MVKTCCVKWCASEAYAGCGISFFSFPKNEPLLQQWLEVVPFKTKCTASSFICSHHFKKEDITIHLVKSRLQPHAIPSIFPRQFESRSKQVNDDRVAKGFSEPTPRLSIESSLKKPREDENRNNVHAEKPILLLIEPPLKNPREYEYLKNLEAETSKLQQKVKILTQRLKRRDSKINILKSVLNIKSKSKIQIKYIYFTQGPNHYISVV